MLRSKASWGGRSVPSAWVSAGGSNQRCPLRLPRENRSSLSFLLGNAAEGDAAPTPPRIRLYLHPADLTPPSCRRGRQAEAGDGGRSGKHKGQKASSHLTMAPSLDLLPSGRRDEMKSNGEGERASEREDCQRTGGRTSRQVSSAFKLLRADHYREDGGAAALHRRR